MKRPYENTGATHVKRIRHQNQDQRSHTRSSNGTTGRDQDKHSQHIEPYVDTLSTLETLLKAITTSPKATTSCLGVDAVAHAQGLLAGLTARKTVTATTSLDVFQPSVHEHHNVPAYYAGTYLRSYPLPTLPEIPQTDPLHAAPFTHKSVTGSDRVISTSVDYERLEFLGDAYLESMATRLIFSRYPHMALGRQSQIRERLVKNETLCGFARAYSFQDRVATTDNERRADAGPGNKGLNKILADAFEAYVAALILSDPETGFARTEAWLTELWAPILLEHYGPESKDSLLAAYNPNAKTELQNKLGVGIFDDEKVAIEYREDKAMQQTKHGQVFTVGVYLTGWGHNAHCLGSGSGQNKAEAGARAAMAAMETSNTLIQELEQRCIAKKAVRDVERQKKRDEKDAKRAQSSAMQP